MSGIRVNINLEMFFEENSFLLDKLNVFFLLKDPLIFHFINFHTKFHFI